MAATPQRIPDVSVTQAELDAVSRDEVIACTVFLRLYASLSAEQKVHALLAADVGAIARALAETYQHAHDAGYKKGWADATSEEHQQAIAANKATVAAALAEDPERGYRYLPRSAEVIRNGVAAAWEREAGS
jgi:hypothetical protein